MYIYIYMYIYIWYIYVYIYVHICNIYECVCAWLRAQWWLSVAWFPRLVVRDIYVYIHARIYDIYMCTYMYIFTNINVCVCLCVSLCAQWWLSVAWFPRRVRVPDIRKYIHMYIYIYIYIYITWIHVDCIVRYICIHVYTCVYMCIHVHMSERLRCLGGGWGQRLDKIMGTNMCVHAQVCGINMCVY